MTSAASKSPLFLFLNSLRAAVEFTVQLDAHTCTSPPLLQDKSIPAAAKNREDQHVAKPEHMQYHQADTRCPQSTHCLA